MRFRITILTLLVTFCFISTCHQDLFCQKHKSSDNRASLKVPDDLWSYILANAGHEDMVLGYPFVEMDYFDFYGNEFRLKLVWDFFRDVTYLTDFGGVVGDYFLANYQNPSAIAAYSYNMIELEDETRSTRTHIFNDPALDLTAEDFIFDTSEDQENWDTLPQGVKTFIISLVEASNNSSYTLETAFNKSFVAQSLGISEDELDSIDRQQLYDFVSEPWRYSNPSASSFNVMYELDFEALSSGTSVFLSGVTDAIDELKLWFEEYQIPETDFNIIKFHTRAGNVCVLGTGNQEITDPYSLIIDLGGDDTYSGSHAVPRSFTYPIGAIIDISGNDTYNDESGIAQFCTGLFGIGALFDLGGSDVYSSGESSIASAWHGTGILVDYEGDDKYDSTSAWCQGAAHAGVGLLIDIAGNDTYISIQQSQGFASTLGIGAILDVDGDDKYIAKGSWSEFFYNNTALCQGAGFGRRAESGGRSLAGGVGILVEGDGNDSYWGNVYVQGCGYWWAAGIFEDRGGDDRYHSEQLSIGSGPHMAIGCLVDLEGNDRYNVDEGYTVGQYQGCGRDGSIGAFIDGDGNDQYFFTYRCGGAGDMNSIGFFWDRYGDDVYETVSQYWAGEFDKSFGGSRVRAPMGGMRDEIMTVGLFLDTDGHDIYNIDPGEDETKKPLCADNSEWKHNTGPIFWGYGLDIDWYSSNITE